MPEAQKKRRGAKASARTRGKEGGARALAPELPDTRAPRMDGGTRGKYVYCIMQIGAQKGSTYFARMQYGRLVDVALQSMSEKYLAEIFEALRDVAVASRANKPIGDKMIMNAAFLVSRDKEQAFDERVKQIGAKHDKLTFKYTGPWPPYNFVNIRLKLERAKEAK